jgi:SPP1 gp7 family putative phage head morphogenesis protein
VKTTLDPIVHRDGYTDLVARELVAFVSETIFDPLFDLLRADNLRVNENKEHSAVWDALIAGTLWYAAGVFTGKFNAAVSRELRAMGARSTSAGFALPLDEVPIVLRGVISMTAVNSKALHETILSTLDAMQEHIGEAPTGLDFAETVDSITEDLQEQLVQSVSAEASLPPPSEIPVDLTESLNEGLTGEASRAIQGFSLEQIQSLRAKIRANLQDTGRTDRLVKVIEAEFGVSKRRARFIAENETSRMVSDFRRVRYESLGATEYLWDTSHDEKVRTDHRMLDGRKFSWSNPPVADTATGFRGHPGEAANCRCVARPVINFS